MFAVTDKAKLSLAIICARYDERVSLGVPAEKAVRFSRSMIDIDSDLPELLAANVIKTSPRSSLFVLTGTGISLNDSFQKEVERNAAEESKEAEKNTQDRSERIKQRRHEWLVSLISACAGSVLTLCVERFDVLVQLVESLFS